MTRNEAARRMGVCRKTVTRLLRAGQIEFEPAPGRYELLDADVERCMANYRSDPKWFRKLLLRTK